MVDELFEIEVMSFYSKFPCATSNIQSFFSKNVLNFKISISSPQIFIESWRTFCLKQK